MSESSEGSPPSPAGPESDEVLRAKYLDYCSARVAEIFLRLPPDEIFVLAQEAAQLRGLPEERSYDAMVQLATSMIYGRLELPDFQTWAQEYKKNPRIYEAEILGLWETDLGQRSDR